MSHEMLSHIMEIKERVAAIETKQDAQGVTLEEIRQDVRSHGKDIEQAKTSIRLVRWIMWCLFVALPMTVAAIVRSIRP